MKLKYMTTGLLIGLLASSCGGGGGTDTTAPPPAAQATGSIRGSVTDNAGAPLAGVSVQATATGQTARSATTGTDGSYSFAGVKVGAWLVTVTAPTGYSGGTSSTVTVTENQQATVTTIVLTKLATQAPTTATVAISGSSFVPPNVTIKQGGTVTWRNDDDIAHTATGSGFDTGTLQKSASSTKTFATAGTFSYRCSFHADMSGSVVVVP